MGIQLIIEIILIHFLADFALQTNNQAQGKGVGKNLWNFDLFKHCLTYSFVWMIWFFCNVETYAFVIIGTLFIFITHYITDWITSRLSKPLFEEGDIHNAFVIVGADQVVHYITLILFLYYTNGQFI